MAYIDTLTILIPITLPYKTLASRLADLCLGRQDGQCRKTVWPDDSDAEGYREVTMQRPNQEALKLISEIPESKIHEVHAALDLLAHSPAGAKAIGQWMNHRLCKRRDTHRHVEFNTMYLGHDRKDQKSIAIASYSDRPSKLTGSPCHHVEVRAHRAVKCKMLGWHHPSDLVNQNWRFFWSKWLWLREPNWPSILRQCRKNVIPATDMNVKYAIRVLKRRAQVSDQIDPPTQTLLRVCQSSPWITSIKHAIPAIDNTRFLPVAA